MKRNKLILLPLLVDRTSNFRDLKREILLSSRILRSDELPEFGILIIKELYWGMGEIVDIVIPELQISSQFRLLTSWDAVMIDSSERNDPELQSDMSVIRSTCNYYGIKELVFEGWNAHCQLLRDKDNVHLIDLSDLKGAMHQETFARAFEQLTFTSD